MADLQPDSGTPESLVERLRAYVALVDPEMPARWRGATEAELSKYAQSALGADASALPASYRAFVRHLGADDGGLFANLRADTRMRTCLRYYEESVGYDAGSVCTELPVVAVYIIGDQLSLDLREPYQQPPVVETSDGEPTRTVARDWESLVMQAAMLHVESHRLPHAHWFGSSSVSARAATKGRDPIRAAHEALAEYASQLELTAAWPSDAQHAIAISESRSVFATIGADGAVLASLFSRDGVFGHREEALAATLGAGLSGRARVVDGRLQSLTDRHHALE